MVGRLKDPWPNQQEKQQAGSEPTVNKEKLLEHFRNYRRELNETRHFYLPDPRSVNTMERLSYHGSHAARYAAELRQLIETMEAYQQIIFDRVQELTTAPYHTELHLERERRYDNKVKYHLLVKKVYDTPGIEPETIERTTYPGTERHKAIADFEAYKKSHPGIIAVKDIAKGKWER